MQRVWVLFLIVCISACAGIAPARGDSIAQHLPPPLDLGDWGKLQGNPARPVKAIYFFPGDPRTDALKLFTQYPEDQRANFHWSDDPAARAATVSAMRGVGANTIFEVYKGYYDCGPHFMKDTLDDFMALWEVLDQQSAEPPMKIVPSMEDIADIPPGDPCPVRFHVPEALNPDDLNNAVDHVVGLVNLIRSRNMMDHWAQLLDSKGESRYAINLTKAGSKHIATGDDPRFVSTLDELAKRVHEKTTTWVGFTLDPMVGAGEAPDKYSLTTREGPEGENVSVANLRSSESLLAIVPFASELDGIAAFCQQRRVDGQGLADKGRAVDCNANTREVQAAMQAVMRYKKNFIKAWAASGVPTFLDLDRGYDAHLVNNPAFALAHPTPEQKNDPNFWPTTAIWGSESELSTPWLNIQSEIKGHQGEGNPAIAGVIYNSWNGYAEGMVAVPSIRPAWNEHGTNQDLDPFYNAGVPLPVPYPYTREPRERCGQWCDSYHSGDVHLRWLSDVFSVDPGLCDHYYYGLLPGPTGQPQGRPIHHVFGSICEKFTQLYGQIGVLGVPAGDAKPAGIPGWVFQEFANGRVYWSPETGAHEVHGGIYAHYGTLRLETGDLGPPLSDETGTPDGRGRFNAFEKGSIYWTPETLGYGIWGGVRDEWARLGYERGWLGYPTSDTLLNGVLCPGSRSNFFEHGEIEWCESDGRVQVRRFS